MANTSTRGILLTMLSAVTFGFAFTLGPMTLARLAAIR